LHDIVKLAIDKNSKNHNAKLSSKYFIVLKERLLSNFVVIGLMSLSEGAALKKAKPLNKLRPVCYGSPFAVKALLF